MTREVLRRALAMSPAEIRFRTACAARLWLGRTAALVAVPRWRRERLARRLVGAGREPLMLEARRRLDQKDWFGAHEALARHFAARSSSFPADAFRLDDVAHTIRERFPDAAATARERAARILRSCYDLLGYPNVQCAPDPDWHQDPVSGRRAAKEFWADVPYLDSAFGDHKVTWELNRHQHWLQLGRAFRLTGDRAYYDRFVAELESWLAANPPLTGTNWASMLELGFRAISWLWAVQFFSPAASRNDRFPWVVDLLLGLDRQLEHVSHNLSRYFSPNTHLTGEALALYVAGQTLPELRRARAWAALGRQVLVDEARRQIAADGGHAELSAHYHRYSTDFYLLALLVARRSRDRAAAVLERAARAQSEYLRVICDDSGGRPFTGDDDGGQLFPICGRAADDCEDTLSTAAVILDDPSLAVGAPTEETYWLCDGVPDRAAAPAAHWPSKVLFDTGYCVSRTPSSDHLLFDSGPHGYLNGGHAHADALSVILSIAGTPLLVDPGTATYTMDPVVRDRFRSTAMHNTLTVGGRPQSQPRGPFQWASQASARANVALVGLGCDYFEGAHEGYAPHRHTRAVLSVHGVGWFIFDFVSGGASATADAWWHLHPIWRPAPRTPSASAATYESQMVELLSSEPLETIGPGHTHSQVSLAYGRIEASSTLQSSLLGVPPLVLMTAIDPTPDPAAAGAVSRRAVVGAAGAGWSTAAFQAEMGRATVSILVAVEDGTRTRSAASPQILWGSEDLQTDARLACLITHDSGRTEAVLVHGSRLEAGHGTVALECDAPNQLIRAAAQLANGVHPVIAGR